VQGKSLEKRIEILEEHWDYYAGFGIVPTTICFFSSTLASSALFAFVLPVVRAFKL
jgi:hypothetical protein